MTETTSSCGFTRRSFIKGVAAVTAAGALAGCTPKEDDKQRVDPADTPETVLYTGACRGNCYGGCPLNIHVRDGQVVRTTAYELPDPAYSRICSKGLTNVFRMYSAERIQYPMRRVGERGSGEFERITWDEAIETIVSKWKGYMAEYGSSSVAFYMGSGSYSIVNGMTNGNPTQRLLNAIGATFINQTVDYGAMGTIGFTPSTGGLYSAGNDHADMVNAKTILIWGANPIVSEVHDVHRLMDAKEAGAKIVVIDPQYNNMVEKADLFVPIRPATDAMLGIAMCKLMVERGWVNKEFLLTHSSAAHLVKSSDGMFLTTADLDASVPAEEAKPCVVDADGRIVPFDEAAAPTMEASLVTEGGLEVSTSYSLFLARLAEYDMEVCLDTCGLSLELVEELTDTYVNGGPAQLYRNMGVDHYVNGTSGFVAQATVMMLAGQVGGSGRGMICCMSSGHLIDMAVGSLATDPEAPQGPFGWHKYSGHGISILSMGDVMETNRYMGQEVHIKSLFANFVNPLTSAADKNHVIDWLSKIEFIVIADVNMNESVQYADIVLPAAYWFEVEDVFAYAATHPYAVIQEKAVKPLFESRSDFEIIKALAEGLGVGDWFDMSEGEYVDMVLTAQAGELGISYDALKENKVMHMNGGKPVIYAEDGNHGGFYNLYRPIPYPMLNAGATYDAPLYKMIYWEPPAEVGYDNPLRKKYPYQLFSDHSRFRTHSQWWDVEPLVEIDKEPSIKMCPRDAEALGLAEGDVVRAYNDRGEMVMRVAIHAGLQPGMMAAEKGWPKHQLRGGDFATLSGSYAHPFVNNSPFNDVLVAIEKVS